MVFLKLLAFAGVVLLLVEFIRTTTAKGRLDRLRQEMHDELKAYVGYKGERELSFSLLQYLAWKRGDTANCVEISTDTFGDAVVADYLSKSCCPGYWLKRSGPGLDDTVFINFCHYDELEKFREKFGEMIVLEDPFEFQRDMPEFMLRQARVEARHY